ncbi:MAG: type II toxin-antitoxin system VapC family toxin [Opitutales bacterium]|nr:type II toxin-antitoxin system VapC family toxin [Opitutales bacterium]MCH8541801.1 type II toxin-antitoxin system VapC family toxin [Opitutales bacterium]
MGLILDTSALIAWERSGYGNLPEASFGEERIHLPAIVWAEALIGVRMAPNAHRAATRLARLQAIRRILGIEPFSDVVAEHYADIFFTLSQAGQLIPQNDIQVAATARSLKAGVLIGPNDEAHFGRIPGLRIEIWQPSQGKGGK